MVEDGLHEPAREEKALYPHCQLGWQNASVGRLGGIQLGMARNRVPENRKGA